ncbi:DNA polymerase III subunit alpha [Brachyspira pilosicoli]|uniref:DNA polymerase III subunit alpha n=1 Tax=Brachyspira pilosicoli TaxID=52584 RepID=UPI001CA5B63A|nr:DNA polymerase III subunit alpha [Brachyspira pilosicoli]MBW5396576.1 DNA polymerase III subunit alpha [Brachyspira pilosicoli]
MSFVHLHVHTQYSILDGAARIKSLYSKTDKTKRLIPGLIDRAKELDMPAIAMTDHGNMFGAMEFFSEAKDKGIIPIIGCEVYVAPKTRFDKKLDNSEEKSAMHLVLLAKDKEGYNNLCKLVTHGYTEGFYYRPRVDHELIEKYNKGLICLSACMGGEIPIALRKKDYKQALQLARYYKSIFGEDFYIELQDHGLAEEKTLNSDLYKVAKNENIELVVTNDVHYVLKEDAKAHEILLAIQTKATLDSPRRYKFPSNEFHLKTEEEMKKSFAKLPKAFENTVKIAEQCKDLNIMTKTYYMPNYELPNGETETTALRKMCIEGLNKHYNNDIPKEAMERLDMELGVIAKMGFEGYFLVVQDFINYARNHDVAVGPGRGSAAGSIVAFASGITKVNPLDYNLLFERFLNPERKSMPDIDVDFQDDKREVVIDYVTKKYGKDNVSQIATFGALGGRSVIRDVCRVMGIDLATADRLAKSIPDDIKRVVDIYDHPDCAEFRKEIDNSRELKNMYEISMRLDGLVRNVGLHAAGVIISSHPIADLAPVYQDSKTGTRACQYEMTYVESAGLIKMDFLGIKNLRLIKDAIKDIKERYGKEIDIDKIPLDDEAVYKIFRHADTGGVFQFESPGMRQMLLNIQPTAFDDLVSSVALFRPGPLKSGMDKDYADRKNKRKEIVYKHPDLEPILKESQGVLIYQEQIMAISRAIGGFTAAEADDLRKAMGKKIVEKMNSMREKFISGGLERGYDEELLNYLFDTMKGFAEYGFNKSHSVCYALIAYQEAYIKAHYPMEYYVALLNTVIADTDKIALYLNEIKQKNIEVVSASVFESDALFSQKNGKIVYALHAVKGVGLQAALAIQEERENNGQFKNLEDFVKRVDVHLVNRKVYETLIKCGAFSEFGHTESALLSSLDAILAHASNYQKETLSGQTMLFDSMSEDDTGSASLVIEKQVEYANNILMENEKEVLGFSLRYHPFARYITKIDYKYFNNLLELEELEDKYEFSIPAILMNISEGTTKKNTPMLILKVMDLFTESTFYITTKTDKYRDLLDENMGILIRGKRDKNKFSGKIYNNIIDIKDLDGVLNDKKNVLKEVKREIKRDNAETLVTENKIPKPSNESPKEVAAVKKENSNNIIKNTNTGKKQLALYVNKNIFDDMDLLCLQNAISSNPGDYTIFLKLKSESGTEVFKIGENYKVDPSQRFLSEAKSALRSLIDIEYA